MRIIKHGNYIPKMYRLECKKCGTIWEEEERKLYVLIRGSGDNGKSYVMDCCPVCGTMGETEIKS